MLKRILFKWWPLIIASLCIAVSIILFASSSFNRNRTEVSRFEKELHRKEKELNVLVKYLEDHSDNATYEHLMNNHGNYYFNLLDKEGYVLLIYENDSLKFWSDNSVPVENYLNRICLDNKIVKLNNGWFQVIRHNKDNKSIIGLLAIKKEYPYHNKYLEDDFESSFRIEQDAEIVRDTLITNNSVHSADGTFLFSLRFNSADQKNPESSFYFFCVGLFFLFLSIYWYWRSNKTIKGFILTVIGLLSLRATLLLFNIPNTFYNNELFNPVLYGHSSINPSLGDFLLNTILFFLCAFKLLHTHFKLRNDKRKSFVLITLSILVLYAVSLEVSSNFKSIVLDSALSFDLTNLFSLTVYSFLGLICVGFLFISYVLLCYSLFTLFDFKGSTFVYTILLLAIFAILLWLAGVHSFAFLWSLLLFPVIIKRPLRVPDNLFSTGTILLFSMSAISVVMLLQFTRQKEKENVKVFAENLSAEKDPVAEYLFSAVQKKLATDSILLNNITPVLNGTELLKRLRQDFLNGYWEKFDIDVSVYDTICNPLLVENPGSRSLGFYEEVVNNSGFPTLSPNLYFSSIDSVTSGYLGKIIFYKKEKEVATMYLEFKPRFSADINGFPELLLDKKISNTTGHEMYSFARYKNNRLFAHNGAFNYPTDGKLLNTTNKRESFFITDNFEHYKLQTSRDRFIVISKQKNNSFMFITSFSFLFSLFSILLLIYSFIVTGPKRFISSNTSFKTKIQSVLILLIVLSLLLFGTGSALLIRQQFVNKNNTILSNKLNTVLLQMKQKIAEDGSALTHPYYLSYLLTRLSNINVSDILLYDKNGNLLASSTPKLFEEGLLSKKMNPLAYNEIVIKKKVAYLNDELIGKLKYKSAYAPLMDDKDNVLAYVNLPYFARESDLQHEISAFIVALINVYVFLFAISIAIAIIISERIVMPLRMLRKKLSDVRLGIKNEYISWENKDEIGELINQYNHMIEELGISAEKLARSERESAWREMAKQVAHEIKNPLTPMKLSVQQLEKAWNDKAPGWEERFKKFCHNLVGQIDTLSGIANEFSNFAKMPKGEHLPVNVSEVVVSVIELYKNDETIKFIVDVKAINDVRALADKEQLIRIMNNLIKNALQSIPDERDGIIEVKGYKENSRVIVSVKDNGTGMTEEVRSKIFVPNFTTKNSGMGLGLAMVKTMIEQGGGEVWFETEENAGTIFFIALPLAESK